MAAFWATLIAWTTAAAPGSVVGMFSSCTFLVAPSSFPASSFLSPTPPLELLPAPPVELLWKVRFTPGGDPHTRPQPDERCASGDSHAFDDHDRAPRWFWYPLNTPKAPSDDDDLSQVWVTRITDLPEEVTETRPKQLTVFALFARAMAYRSDATARPDASLVGPIASHGKTTRNASVEIDVEKKIE
jgi:hypothetical protein|tara:strand:+ start:1022 stop:1582 length:561 start_codon:yes stop_codon:yes gene_type:complete